MFVKSSLDIDVPHKSQAWQLEPSPFFAAVSWQNESAHAYNDFEGSYGLSGVMHASHLATSPQVVTYPTGSYAQTEKQETGSDVSTADTSPYEYVSDEPCYVDMWNADASEMPWHSAYAAVDPSAQPWPQSWQHADWGDLGQVLDVPEPEVMPEVVTAGKHLNGQCKPCAFAWKPEGCVSGADCKFCHFCPPGEKQRRKRVMRQLQRSAGLC